MRDRAIAVTIMIAAIAVLLLASASVAAARQLVTHNFSSSFDGAASTAGPFGNDIASVAVDEVSGDVYVLTDKFVIDKFDASGTPSAFAELQGDNSLRVLNEEAQPGELHIFVDNSTTSTQGRIYVVTSRSFREKIYAYESDGTPVGGNFPVHDKFQIVSGLAVEQDTGDLLLATLFGGRSARYTSSGEFTDEEYPLLAQPEGNGFRIGGSTTGFDSEGNFFLGHTELIPGIEKYDRDGSFVYKLLAPGAFTFKINPTIDDVYTLGEMVVQYDKKGEKVAEFGSFGDARDIAVNGANGNVYVARGGGANRVDIFSPGVTVPVPDVTTEPASEFEGASAQLNGTINPDGQDTTDCHFEWSADKSFSKSAPCTQGNVLSGSSPQQVSAVVTGVAIGHSYNYRLAAANSNGAVSALQGSFVASSVPTFGAQWVTDVHSDSVRIHTEIVAEGAPTTYRIEYGTEDCAVSSCSQSGVESAGSGLSAQPHNTFLGGLKPGTTYHYRVTATNQSDTAYGADRTFTTFPFTALIEDHCANAHVRQQVSAALLPDCRAYELVSAADTGGYNVESDLAPGEHPFAGYPDAPERVLYGIHSGAIPGPWNPTNRGVDPYLASRGTDGWHTTYAGIPADNPFATAPFSSSLDEANASLSSLAFGGPEICSPCFEDGTTGIPVREPDGSLIQGMAGSEDPGSGATSDGVVRRRLSADGTHLIFSSTSKFEPTGNESTGDVSIYDRNLETGQTQVVSTDPSGSNLLCEQGAGQCHGPTNAAGIAELAVSKDGSRIIVGQRIATDAKGNNYFHLYMHVGTDPETVDLTPGTTSGVQFDGMNEDGTIVYFTTVDPLVTATDQDSDTSADIFRADVSSSSAILTRISIGEGATGNVDSCSPVGVPDTWNAPVGGGKCGALAFAGGAGVASKSGDIYFLSPEALDSSDPEDLPTENQPNVYLAQPGSTPRFVATIDTSEGTHPPPPTHPLSNTEFISGLNAAEGLAVDQSNGDLYVIQRGSKKLARYTSAGVPDEFTALGSNEFTANPGAEEGRAGVAVDNAPSSPLNGDFYVKRSSIFVQVRAPNGEELGELPEVGVVCGLAVDQSDGAVYVSAPFEETVFRFEPISGSTPIGPANYVKTGIHTPGFEPCNLAADTEGHVYVSAASGEGPTEGPLYSYDASEFSGGIPTVTGTVISPVGRYAYVDPETNEVYVDEGEEIAQFDSHGKLVQKFGSGAIGTNSRGVAVNAATKHVYVSTGPTVAEFGAQPAPYAPIKNPAVVHAVTQAETHSYGDVQVTPDGHFVTFTSTTPFTGHDNNGYYEVFRYGKEEDELACASCNPTGALTVGESSLAAGGLGLANDGTVFFNSSDPLAPRDLDERQDVYEWRTGGVPQLISTGVSPFDSSLLTVSVDGQDAFFFTRDTLVSQDQNGTLAKVYDARVQGGFPFVAEPKSCKASDECHGPGSEAAPPAKIGSIVGVDGNVKGPHCRKGFVRRGGHCRRRHKPHHHRHHRRRGH